MSVAEQVVSIFAGVNGFLDKIAVGDVTRFEQSLISDMHANNSDVMDTITNKAMVSDETEAKLKEVIGNFAENFV
jgi:F-type H+-transporting ATPase subunit alpha